MIIASRTHRFICIILIGIQIFTTVTGYTYEWIPILSELSGGSISWSEDSIAALIRERDSYSIEHSWLTDVTTFDSHSDLLGSTYIIEKSSRVKGEIDNRMVTSDLLYNTLVRNMSDSKMDPKSIHVSRATPLEEDSARHKFQENIGNHRDTGETQVITFEFGIPGNHLIFSKPVLLSIDAWNIPDGSWVDLLVLHTWDTDYNTSGLMTDWNGECLPDGTASNPANRAKVVGSQVSFYTCGASTFALGYVPARDLPSSTVWTLAPTTDNKIIIGWAFTTVWWVTMGRVARVSTGGFLDTTFTNPNANNIVYATAIQSDNKIIIWWTFTSVGWTARTYLARLNTDGTLDATFNPVIVWSQIRAIKIQSDNKILIWWTFTTVWWVARNRIARLNTDGTLDLTFNANSNNTVYAITVQSDNKILIWWTFTTMWWVTRTKIARVSPLWVLDLTFNPVLTATAIWDIEIQTDGQIVLGWQFTVVSGTTRNNIARVSPLWVLDLTFNPNASTTVQAILIENTWDMLIWWAFVTIWWVARNRIARIDSTWVLDLTLNPNASSTVYALGKDQSFNLLVGWAFTTMSAKAVPYFSWVWLNTDFTSPNITSISLASGSLLPIGKLVITTTYNDPWVGVDTSSVAITLEKWNGTTWWSNIAATYLAWVPIITTGTGIHSLAGIPYGKYRYRTYVSDLAGNQGFIERIFYIDAIEWIVNQPSVDIGNVVWNIQKNSSPDEFIITVKTVGVPFSLTMSGSELAMSGSLIPHWTWVYGYGYEKFLWTYSWTLSNLSGWAYIISQPGSINIDGNKNTYTYRIQFGTRVSAEQEAGNYVAPISLQMVSSY